MHLPSVIHAFQLILRQPAELFLSYITFDNKLLTLNSDSKLEDVPMIVVGGTQVLRCWCCNQQWASRLLAMWQMRWRTVLSCTRLGYTLQGSHYLAPAGRPQSAPTLSRPPSRLLHLSTASRADKLITCSAACDYNVHFEFNGPCVTKSLFNLSCKQCGILFGVRERQSIVFCLDACGGLCLPHMPQSSLHTANVAPAAQPLGSCRA